MKKLLVAGLFLTGFLLTSHAQDTTHSPKQEMKKQERKKMVADLNLTPEQSKQMKEVNEDFKGKARAIKENQSLGKKEKKDQFLALTKERTDKLNAFLTPEQQARLTEEKKMAKRPKR